MKALIQRVEKASVRVGDETVGAIGAGLLVLLGVGHEDRETQVKLLAGRVVNLRVFEDEDGKMNLSALDARAALLVVSQFTLMGDTRRGRRPSFVDAAPPEHARPLVDGFVAELNRLTMPEGDSPAGSSDAPSTRVATGRFGADMKIDLVADGPVTLMLDTEERRRG